ncbi:hypothetical protein [uncultured Megasphaera sp.]|uniref:hypothetical protein n=1 Tax=uncultured Megasphaera sp. TaxID=165188 RepID=UPI0005C90EB9|nr:hypothetical protein [uncultured Megasphaera sp.]
MRKADTVIYLGCLVSAFVMEVIFLGTKNVRTCKFYTGKYNEDNPMTGRPYAKRRLDHGI